MELIQNICNSKSFNLGDRSSSPFNYFSTNCNVKIFNIHKLDGDKPKEKCDYLKSIDLSKPVVFGGGGLLYYQDKIFNWYKIFEYLIENSKSKIICWGVGLNNYKYNNLPSFLNKIDLVGIRSKEKEYFFVPCPSCLSNEFDKSSLPQYDFVIYEHYENPIGLSLNCPRKKNVGNFKETIDFISSADCLITNTYHGIYWGTLLKRKVILYNSDRSSRFFNFPFPFTSLESKSDLASAIKKANIYEDSLEICRQKNLDFSDRVSDCLGVQFNLISNAQIPILKI